MFGTLRYQQLMKILNSSDWIIHKLNL